MKKSLFALLLTISAAVAFGQSCITCDENTINFENGASAIGTQNLSSGINSLAVGYQCEATGDYAQAFGNIVKATARSSFASGFLSEAHGVFSVAMGYGAKTGSHSAIALGFNVEAMAPASFVTGRFVKSTASNAITMGSGIGVEDNEYLKNNFVSSFMVGFSSVNPTFFISNSPSGGDKTGSIGIGNITAPFAKLHILGDNDDSRPDNASLYIQSAGNYYSTIWLGDTSHYIKTKPNEDLVFNAANENFIFKSGNMGVGTNEPEAKIQVKDGDIFIEDINRGIIMKSPDGNCWRGTMNNQGMMEFAQVDCNTLLAGTLEETPDAASAVKIYPNPAGNQVFISCNANFNTLKLEITNMNGQLISAHKLSNSESFIDFSAYQPGAYIFRLTDENGKQVATQKVIKE